MLVAAAGETGQSPTHAPVALAEGGEAGDAVADTP